MLDPKRQLSVMFGAPVTCVSPIQRPRIESFDKTEPKRPRVQSFDTDGRREGLELHEGLYDGLPPPKNRKVPVVTPKVPVMAAMPEVKRPPAPGARTRTRVRVGANSKNSSKRA